MDRLTCKLEAVYPVNYECLSKWTRSLCPDDISTRQGRADLPISNENIWKIQPKQTIGTIQTASSNDCSKYNHLHIFLHITLSTEHFPSSGHQYQPASLTKQRSPYPFLLFPLFPNLVYLSFRIPVHQTARWLLSTLKLHASSTYWCSKCYVGLMPPHADCGEGCSIAVVHA